MCLEILPQQVIDFCNIHQKAIICEIDGVYSRLSDMEPELAKLIVGHWADIGFLPTRDYYFEKRAV